MSQKINNLPHIPFLRQTFAAATVKILILSINIQMKLYGIPNCNTVKKARDWLATNAIAYEFQDFKKGVADKALLTDWLKQQPWEKLINRTGMTWRNLSDTEKYLIIDSASAQLLMLEKTSVIKRPVLVKDGHIISIGFSEQAYQDAFSI